MSEIIIASYWTHQHTTERQTQHREFLGISSNQMLFLTSVVSFEVENDARLWWSNLVHFFIYCSYCTTILCYIYTQRKKSSVSCNFGCDFLIKLRTNVGSWKKNRFFSKINILLKKIFSTTFLKNSGMRFWQLFLCFCNSKSTVVRIYTNFSLWNKTYIYMYVRESFICLFSLDFHFVFSLDP